MTETQAPATQAQLDEMTYNMYVDASLNKAATAREMGISASTVADRVKRHSLRLAQADIEARENAEAAQAQDAAGEPARGSDEYWAEEDRQYAADSAAGPHPVATISITDAIAGATRAANAAKEQRFASTLLGVMSGAVTVDEAYSELTGEPVEQAPVTEVAENVVVVRPGSISGFVAQATAAATEAAVAAKAGYEGAVCPECDAIAYAYKGGHFTGCRYHKLNAAAAGHVAEVTASATEVPAEQPEQPAEGGQDGMVDHCIKCGWDFGHATTQQTCGSAKMCQRRQDLGNPAFGRRKSA
jgi:hypothetical protein